MQYTDIKSDARWLVNANAQTYKDADLTRNANRWLDRAVSIIIPASGEWQFDDTNYTDFPFSTRSTVSGQQDYALEVTFLKITGVEIKDTDGNWHKLKLIEPARMEEARAEIQSTNGLPQYYDVTANSVFLYPAPNYSQNSSLKVYYQRKGSYFDVEDTTKAPGFAEIFHRYISIGSAYDFASKNRMSIAKDLFTQTVQMEREIKDFYSSRNVEMHRRMTPNTESTK